MAGLEVLELGCGAGDLSLQLARRGARVTALDLSPGMVELARQRVPEGRFLVAPAEDTGLPDESFDRVVGKAVLHHVDVSAAARETRRLLRPGGRAVFFENQDRNPLLRVARRRLFGAPRLNWVGTQDEHALTRADIGELANNFDSLELSYPSFYFFEALSRALQHRWHGQLRRLDSLVWRAVPPARPWSWHVLIVAERARVAVMGERTSHPPGTFSWTDLATSDPDDAKRFYTGLFGWDFEDQPMPGEGGVYTMLRKDGKDVAALFQAREGMPTFWGSYVTVESADSAAARATDLGGTLVMEPFDVMEAGRMAVIHDPTGAIFSVWEPHGSIGANLVNVPGALTLNQLNTTDPQAAERFYTELFGWRTEEYPGGPAPYWGIFLGDRVNGGMMQLPEEAGAPSHWLTYFGSADVDADAGRVGELGGRVTLAPMDVPGGRIIVAQDPQGAFFGVFAGRFDD